MDVSIGLGILVGCTMICLTAIYVFTRNRWNWRKILFYSSTIIILCLAIFTSIYLIENNRNKKYFELSKIERDKGFVKRFWGLTFTNTFSDVIYYKGNPNEIYSNENGGVTLVYNGYRDEISRKVEFKEKTSPEDKNSTNEIDSITSFENSDIDFINFGDAKIGDSVSSVQRNFSIKLSEIQFSNDLTRRAYRIGSIFFVFQSDKLDYVVVFSTNRLSRISGTNLVRIK